MKTILSLLFCIFAATTLSAEVTPAQKHVVIVVGTHHYSPHKSMPLFAETLQKIGLKTTVLNPDWNPEKGDKGIPGLEALAEADLAIFFTRFLKIEDPQLKHITDYLASGKPVVGLRTSAHGFNYPADNPNSKWNNDFGRDALGTPYLIHLVGKTKLKLAEGVEAHPILTGIKPTTDWISPGTLYLTDLSKKGVTPLVLGTGNSKRTGPVTNQFGTHELQKEMTDVLAWTWTNKWGGKTFTTSLGHTGDFAVEPSLRLIVNGVFWSLGQDVPPADQAIEPFKIAGKKKNKK